MIYNSSHILYINIKENVMVIYVVNKIVLYVVNKMVIYVVNL